MKYKFKNVVIRRVGEEYQLCHTRGGIYNCFARYDSEEEARKYAESQGLKCSKKIICGDNLYVNENN